MSRAVATRTGGQPRSENGGASGAGDGRDEQGDEGEGEAHVFLPGYGHQEGRPPPSVRASTCQQDDPMDPHPGRLV